MDIYFPMPGHASDFLSWVNSNLYSRLEKGEVILPGHTIVGDNAFVETNYMSVPVHGTFLEEVDDAYNFFLSQLRITVERAFGVLVHRYGILRRPLSNTSRPSAFLPVWHLIW